jgi:hypothetical protein
LVVFSAIASGWRPAIRGSESRGPPAIRRAACIANGRDGLSAADRGDGRVGERASADVPPRRRCSGQRQASEVLRSKSSRGLRGCRWRKFLRHNRLGCEGAFAECQGETLRLIEKPPDISGECACVQTTKAPISNFSLDSRKLLLNRNPSQLIEQMFHNLGIPKFRARTLCFEARIISRGASGLTHSIIRRFIEFPNFADRPNGTFAVNDFASL